jgi:hypothetical protein
MKSAVLLMFLAACSSPLAPETSPRPEPRPEVRQ